jgi:hypothetical protein
MNARDTYTSWVEKRRAVRIDQGFASAVMARIRRGDAPPTDRGGRRAIRWAAAAACLVGAAVAVFRGLSACLALLAISGDAS